MTSQVKLLVAKPENLFGSWNPHSRRKGTDRLLQAAVGPHTQWCMLLPTQTNRCKANKTKLCSVTLVKLCGILENTLAPTQDGPGSPVGELREYKLLLDSHAGVTTSRCPHRQDGYSSLPPPAPPRPLRPISFPLLNIYLPHFHRGKA